MSLQAIKLAIIIPFFQREAGLLRHTITAVLEQKNLPAYVVIEIFVVDDGSPIAADSEILGLELPSHILIKLIKQPNAGCSAARNKALQSLDESTKYVAFLDSDDIWHLDYLSTAINALEKGFDCFFCDNQRPGHHPSQFYSNLKLIAPHIEAQGSNKQLYELSREQFTSLILQDFPAQASTVIYRRAIATDLLFERSVRTAGEDMIFFVELSCRTERVCFSKNVLVTCGSGINIYFSNLSWDSPGHLRQVSDRLRSHQIIKKSVRLSPTDMRWNNNLVGILRRKFVYLSLRHFTKTRGAWPIELKTKIAEDKKFVFRFIIDAAYVMVGRALKLYLPP